MSCRAKAESQGGFSPADSTQPSVPHTGHTLRAWGSELRTEVPQGKKTPPPTPRKWTPPIFSHDYPGTFTFPYIGLTQEQAPTSRREWPIRLQSLPSHPSSPSSHVLAGSWAEVSPVILPKTSPLGLKEKGKKTKLRQSPSIKVVTSKRPSGAVWRDERTGGWPVRPFSRWRRSLHVHIGICRRGTPGWVGCPGPMATCTRGVPTPHGLKNSFVSVTVTRDLGRNNMKYF